MTRTIPLSKPLATHKGEIRELVLNEPTARSFVDHGEPFKPRFKDGNVEFDYFNPAMLAFIADMSGVEVLILKDLPAKDYLTARAEATNILLGVLGETPTEPPAA